MAEGKANSSNLYLVTFLATLFLLLFVSCAIVLRSYLLRRRFQRQVEHALAHGIVLTPRAPGSRKKRFGSRPHMYESWVAPLHVSGLSGSRVGGGGRWSDMLPLTVQTVIVKRRPRDNSLAPPSAAPETGVPPESAHPGDVTPQPVEQSPSRLGGLFSRFKSSSSPSSSSPAPQQQPTSTPTTGQPRRPGIFEMPHPNTNVDTEELLPASPPRDRQESLPSASRSRRESLTAQLRTIVAPSPTLAHAAALSTALASASASPSSPGGMSPAVAAAAQQAMQEREAVATDHLTRAGFIAPPRARRQDLPSLSTRWDWERDAAAADTALSPATASAHPGRAAPQGRNGPRIRVEMLQIAVLVAMPDVRASVLYGDAGVVKKMKVEDSEGEGHRKRKRRRSREVVDPEEEGDEEIVSIPGDDESSSSSSEDEDEEEETTPLPEMVVGVTRLSYRHGGATPTVANPNFVVPSSPPPPPPVGVRVPTPPPVMPIPVPVSVLDTPPRQSQEGAALPPAGNSTSIS